MWGIHPSWMKTSRSSSLMFVDQDPTSRCWGEFSTCPSRPSETEAWLFRYQPQPRTHSPRASCRVSNCSERWKNRRRKTNQTTARTSVGTSQRKSFENYVHPTMPHMWKHSVPNLDVSISKLRATTFPKYNKLRDPVTFLGCWYLMLRGSTKSKKSSRSSLSGSSKADISDTSWSRARWPIRKLTSSTKTICCFPC